MIALIGCGGSSSPPPTPPPGGGGSGPITVAGGATVSAVNISVASPAGANPDAQHLGVAELSGPGEAFNTGDSIRRGETKRVLLFGPGLEASMTVRISGPSDIEISAVRSITASTNDTPGIAFTAVVSPNAALGARTVSLQKTNNDVTTFTGSLEVLP